MGYSSEVFVVSKTVGVVGQPLIEASVLPDATPEYFECQELAERDFDAKLHWMQNEDNRLLGFGMRGNQTFWYRAVAVTIYHEQPIELETVNPNFGVDTTGGAS